ncbi:hypothetical protein Nmel_005566, partial [Mimus melanotis]
AAAAAPALLPLPGHIPDCPPGQQPHHQCRSLRPPPAHPYVLLPAQPGPQRPGLHLHRCPQSHAQFPLGHQDHLLCLMCSPTTFFVFVFFISTVFPPDHHVLRPLHVHLQTPALQDPPGQQSLCPHGSSYLGLWLSLLTAAHCQYIFPAPVPWKCPGSVLL